MKKLLWISVIDRSASGGKDSKEFWKVFSEEREKVRRKRRKLPFAKKIEILASMQKLFPKNR